MERLVQRIFLRIRRSSIANQSGQAYMEYILLVIACVIALRVFSVAFQVAIRHYLRPIYFFVSLPLP
jgi:hypothetical protein